jgi:FkbM family methyltransferase
MTKLASVLGHLPFTVNVFGRKRNLIVGLGDFLYKPKTLKEVYCHGQILDLSGSEHFKILAYATENFIRDFETSDLGMFMREQVKMGDVFIDIGANLGGYSLMAGELGCEVHCFEPVPELVEILKRNEHVFGHVLPIAVSDSKGTMDFFISDENVGGSSLVESDSGWESSGYSKSTKVETNTFDQLCEEGHLPEGPIKLIKIDVEGNEQKVVDGMKSSLESGRIEAIWCEVRGDGSDRNPGTFRTVTQAMQNAGYNVYKWHKGVLETFDVKSDIAPQFFDLLYLKK